MKYLYLLPCLALIGCATSEDYNAYLRSQHELNVAHVANQKPLVEIEAMEGQQITGLKGIRIYTPTQAPVVQQKAPNEWVGVVSQGLGILGTVAGIAVSNRGMVDLANAVGNTNSGYRTPTPVVPQANMTTTTNTYSPVSNSTNTNTSSNASTLSGQGVLGNGSISVPTTTTTTTTDASQRTYPTLNTPQPAQ